MAFLIDGISISLFDKNLFIDSQEFQLFWFILLKIMLISGFGALIIYHFFTLNSFSLSIALKKIIKPQRISEFFWILPGSIAGSIEFYYLFQGRRVVNYRAIGTIAGFIIGTAITLFIIYIWKKIIKIEGIYKIISVFLFFILSGFLLILCDNKIFPNLYPSFHMAVNLGTIILWSVGFNFMFQKFISQKNLKTIQKIEQILSVLMLLSFTFVYIYLNPVQNLYEHYNLRTIFAEKSNFAGKVISFLYKIYPDKTDDDFEAPVNQENNEQPEISLNLSDHDIYILTIDALRADHIKYWGYQRNITPNLDQLAQKSVVFMRNYTTIPETSYAIASMLTGKYIYSLWQMPSVSMEQLTLPTVLESLGYTAVTFHTRAVYFIDRPKFANFEKTGFGFKHKKIDYESDAFKRVEHFEKFISKISTNTKLFTWIHFFDLHEPYLLHPEFNFGDENIDKYDSEIAYVDSALNKLLNIIEKRGKPFLLFITADHGEEFGDHGGQFHGSSLYEEQIHVPLIVYSDKFSPRKIYNPVSIIDIFPTILSLLDASRISTLRGTDLSQYLIGQNAGNEPVFAELGRKKMIIDDEYKLIYDLDTGNIWLNNLKVDPQEKMNFADKLPEVRNKLKSNLNWWIKSHGQWENRAVRVENQNLDWPEVIVLSQEGEPESIRQLPKIINDKNQQIIFRREAAKILALNGNNESCNSLNLQNFEDSELGGWIALCLFKTDRNSETLSSYLNKSSRKLKQEISMALAENGDRSVWPLIKEIIEDKNIDSHIRQRAINIAGSLNIKESIPVLIKALDHLSTRPYVFSALAQMKAYQTLPNLRKALKIERLPNVRETEIKAVVELKDVQSIPILISFLSDPQQPGNTLKGIVDLGGVGQQISGLDLVKNKVKLNKNWNCGAEICSPAHEWAEIQLPRKINKTKNIGLLFYSNVEGGELLVKVDNNILPQQPLTTGWQQIILKLNNINTESQNMKEIYFKIAPTDLTNTGIRAIVYF